MKKKFYLIPLLSLLLTGCTVSVNENGVTYAGEGHAGHVDAGTIILYVVIGLLALGAVALITMIVMSKSAKKQKETLDRRLKAGEITQAQYDADLAKLRIWNKKLWENHY